MGKRVVVIGGGASGFFAAINIANKNPTYEVIILEKSNKVLSKVRVSGGGRCNVTHACFEPKELSINYPRGQRELLGPFNYFSTGDTISWFSERGIELKIEEDGRMFPISNSSETIIDCFTNEAKNLGVKVWLNSDVKEITKESEFQIVLKSGKKLKSDLLIIATGGFPKEKSYDFIKELGHTIESPIPSLFTFNLPKHESNKLMGLSSCATVKIFDTKYEEYGPVLFTHWGMSGPAILKLSAKAAKLLFQKSYQFKYSVEWMPNAEYFINLNRKKNPGKKLLNSKPVDISARLWTYFIERAQISRVKNWADLNKKEIENLTNTLENDVYEANGKTTFKEEFVTAGGIKLNEVNMKTMESKKIPQLYFCGEVLNIDAVTGGFNFQAAWTTAWLISEHLN